MAVISAARLVGGDRGDSRTREEILAGLMRAPGLAGKINTATTAPDAAGGDAVRVLPVRAELAAVLPDGGLRRGTTVAVASSASLLIELMAGTSRAGGWCAVVGMPAFGALAAAAAGVDLNRLALVPDPGSRWPEAVAAMVDGFDLVVVAPGAARVTGSLAGRLDARVRQRGAVLVAFGVATWPGADVLLDVDHEASAWRGLRRGRGRLRFRDLAVTAHRGGQERRTVVQIGDAPISDAAATPPKPGLRVVA
ncbi:hypothetical protein AB0M43_36385 [Longispora sp. NPDC051575]|uniref:hypothetical protein n=1 Tax=Longispora sp. NPDC051575 TaxID=3154943 RepID=UPI003420A556